MLLGRLLILLLVMLILLLLLMTHDVWPIQGRRGTSSRARSTNLSSRTLHWDRLHPIRGERVTSPDNWGIVAGRLRGKVSRAGDVRGKIMLGLLARLAIRVGRRSAHSPRSSRNIRLVAKVIVVINLVATRRATRLSRHSGRSHLLTDNRTRRGFEEGAMGTHGAASWLVISGGWENGMVVGWGIWRLLVASRMVLGHALTLFLAF